MSITGIALVPAALALTRDISRYRCNKIYLFVTAPEKRDLVAQNKKIEILLSRFNPPLCCVITLNAKTLFARKDGRPSLPYSSRAIEVKNEKTLIGSTTTGVINISAYLTTSSVYAIPASSLFYR